MKKIELKPFSLKEAGISQSDIITKKQQKYILGGYEYGLCVWWAPDGDNGGYNKECCISEAYAYTLWTTWEYGASYWGCGLAELTHFCDTYTC